MLRGEFRFTNGDVIPNNISKAGAALLLNLALRGDASAFWVGLVDAAPDPDLLIEDVTEPAIATNGYARLELEQSSVGWPNVGELNGEPYIESKLLTWAATGGNFSQSITRMMLVTSETALTGDVIALSGPLPAARLITPDTIIGERQFRYRIYLR